MENKPTLREQIYSKIEELHNRYHLDAPDLEADHILNLINQALDGLTVMRNEEIIISVCGDCPFEGKFSDEDCHACQRQLEGSIRTQLAKTIREIKERLE